MISKIFLLVGVIAVAEGTFICPPFEMPGISFCSYKCSDMGKKCSITEAQFGCFCWPTYRRDSKGACIPRKKCCTRANEVYSTSGSDRKCDDLSRTVLFPKKEGCYCIPGYVRDKLKNCIPISKCYPKCDKNEEYKKIGCDMSCNINGSTPGSCSPFAKPGCYCKLRYVRSNGKCVLPSKCPCGENENYISNGGCEKDCYEKNCLDCPGPAKCYCTEDTRRGPDGNCITLEQCKDCITEEVKRV